MKRHPLDPVSLVAGLLLFGIGIAVFTGSVDIAEDGIGWLWPAGLIALGLVVLATVKREPQTVVTEIEPSEREDQESV